jgi:pilus assembly protein CpaB
LVKSGFARSCGEVTWKVKRMKPARIIVLVIAVVAGGFAALLAGRSGNVPAPPPPPQKIDTVDVLVAKAEIAMGQVVSAQEMQWQSWPTAAASQHFIRRSAKPNAVEQLSGSIARAAFVIGEPIREAKLIKGGSGFMAAILPAGLRAVSTEISAETGAGGFILPNDRVDVLLTRRDREAERRSGVDTHVTETILTNMRVLAIDQMIQEKDGQRVVVGKTTTARSHSSAGRNAGAFAAARHAVACAPQPRRCQQDRGRRPRRVETPAPWRTRRGALRCVQDGRPKMTSGGTERCSKE